MSRHIMRYYTGSLRNTRQIQIQRKPTTSLRSTLVLFGGLCPHLGLSSVRPSSSSFCCPSDGHIIGLTLPVNSNLVCSGLGLLPERMMLLLFHFFLFFVFYFFTCRLSLPSSWLALRLAFFAAFLLSISWTHHRTDRASKQQPCLLRTRPAP